MSYREYKGNLFASTADTLVNTVNCVGVMGKGVALEFRRRFPDMYENYRSECANGCLKPGDILFYANSHPRVLSLAVKNDWKFPSKYEWVDLCLTRFKSQYHVYGISAVAFPWIGAMNGRLDWSRVQRMMRNHLGNLPDINVEVVEFDPKAADPLFDTLRARVQNLSPPLLAECLHVPERSARIISEAVSSLVATTMSDICQIPGLGKTTIEHLYYYASNELPVREHSQMSLF